MAYLIVLLFDGKQVRREEILDKVKKYHLENGGIDSKANYIGSIKSAIRGLTKKGFCTNPGYGIWRISKNSEVIVEKISEEEQEDISIKIDHKVGNGKNSVYVYYYDTYKHLSELKGETRWYCKIGRTDRDPIDRIYNQSMTCYPEYPHIALVIYTENSNLLEEVLHSILKLKCRHIENSPGNEWFYTNPEEIIGIYNYISKEDT